jgi:hypothetical protein
VQPQRADLRIKRIQVDGGDLGDTRLARQHPAHVRQAQAQLAQRGDQLQPGHARRVIQPPAARGPRRRGQHARYPWSWSVR